MSEIAFLRQVSLLDAVGTSVCIPILAPPQSARLHADRTIKPRAEGAGLLEFHQLDVARESGRAAAREALEEGAHELA